MKLVPRILLLATLFATALPARALHPANIPVARAKVQVDGSIELKVRFDILAYVLDQLPTDVGDPAMNALIDGPISDLQKGLTDAKARFSQGMKIFAGSDSGTVESIVFPTATELHQIIDSGAKSRLPVMVTVTLTGHLPKSAATVGFQFPDALGTVVLTTEFPYQEPISEPVDPGAHSNLLRIPTQKEVDAAASAIQGRDLIRNDPMAEAPRSEAEVRRAIQAQYDAWSAAYMKNDVAKLLSILAPDYSLRTASGSTITRPEYEVILNMRKKKNSDTAVYSTEILRLTLHAGVAALFSREKNITKQRNEKTGKEETVDHEHDYIDVWTFTSGKWLLQSTATQRESTQIKSSK